MNERDSLPVRTTVATVVAVSYRDGGGVAEIGIVPGRVTPSLYGHPPAAWVTVGAPVPPVGAVVEYTPAVVRVCSTGVAGRRGA